MAVNVVAVDNAPDLLEKITYIFQNMEGVNLLGTFEEAVAVVEFVKENPVDMVFTDIVMPDISGISLASELHKLESAPAVVLMSSIPGFAYNAGLEGAVIINKVRESEVGTGFDAYKEEYEKHDIVKMVERYRMEKNMEKQNES